jgi:hypothetical protein
VRLRTFQFSPGPSENAYRISVAVAGFTDAELSIESKENRLTIRGKKQTSDETGDVLYQGIAARTFERILCSRHDPKIAGSDDAEVVGDRITHCRPIPRNVLAQEAERRIGELGDGCVAFVVGDVSVHDAP